MLPQLVFATDRTWSGGTTVWGTAGNWSGSVLPGSPDNAVFNSTFTNQPTLGATATVGGLWMTGSVGQNVTIGGTFALTLSGNTINGTAGLGILVDNANAFTLTINAPLAISTAQSWTNNSANLLSIGAVSLSNRALTVTGSGNTTISGIVTSSNSSGTLTKTGNGTLTLSGVNTFTGQLTVSAGTLSIATINNASTSGTLGSSALAVNLGSSGVTGTLEYSGATASSTKTFALTLGGTGAFQVDTAATILTLSGVISGSGGLQKSGAGTLKLSGTNTYTGVTTVNAGTLSISADTNLGATPGSVTAGKLVFNGGRLGSTATFTLSANRGISLGSNGGTFDVASGTTLTYGGIAAGTGSLTKTNTGTLTLSGVNTYTGATTINAGTLTLSAGSGTSALGSTSSMTVNSGGTVLLGASNQISNTAPMTLAGGTFAKGNFSEGSASTPGVGALTLTLAGSHIDFGTGSVGVLTFASFTPGAFTLTIDNWTGTDRTIGSVSTDRLIFASDQSANLSKFSFTGFGPGGMEFDLGNGYWEVVPVPEASTWVTAGLALGVVGFHFLRRARRRASLGGTAPPGLFVLNSLSSPSLARCRCNRRSLRR